MAAVPGIHHVTAIAGDPQTNVDFYAGLLGLRLVKRTVNFEDPGTYHLYFGDQAGRPGTILTFFPWPGAPRGRHGVGQATSTAFAVRAGSITFWADRLAAAGVSLGEPVSRFGEKVLRLEDPDGLRLELVDRAVGTPDEPWDQGDVPAEHAIRGLAGITIAERDAAATEALLVSALGFRRVERAGTRTRLEAAGRGAGAVVDLIEERDGTSGRIAVGTVHHVAFRASSDAEQQAWRTELLASGLAVSPVKDRNYFRSIYFREPGGVLFEIATDPPGFAIDEPSAELGGSLMLPRWLEPRRTELEAVLPPLSTRPGRGRLSVAARSAPATWLSG
jgi:glyoxalase family protein